MKPLSLRKSIAVLLIAGVLSVSATATAQHVRRVGVSSLFPGIVQAGNALANYLAFAGAAASSPPTITAAGSDTNIDISVVPKGTGKVHFNSSGGILIGNGTSTAITAAPAGQVVVDFASVAAHDCADTTQGASGVAAGDPLAYSATAALPTDFIYSLHSTGAATISIRGCNNTAGAIDPGSVTINWRAIK